MCIFSYLMKSWIVFVVMWFTNSVVFGQYPAYFNYSMENGGPSNEVYNILQDHQGYIWIGCDAGLYRYNGVRFEQFTNPKLTARSVTGLCQSPNGTIYAYNFNGQILIVKNNHLEILENWNHDVNHLSADAKGSIWISSSKGIVQLNEKTRKWKASPDLNRDKKKDDQHFSNGIMAQKNGNLYYMYEGKLFERIKGKPLIHPINLPHPSFITESEKRPWIFGLVDGNCFVPNGNNYVRKTFPQLTKLLAGKKLTNVQEIDGDIWISTYSGIVRFNKKNKTASLLYPKIAFSACLKDNEGSYWFTTLHNGVLRMPNLNYLCWNEETGASTNSQFSHVILGNNKVFFATSAGAIGEIGTSNNAFTITNHEIRSDVGALYFDNIENCLLFNKMNTVFRYCNGKIDVVNGLTRPIKDFYRAKNNYVVATSQGTYLYSLPSKGFQEKECILQDWSRQLLESPFNDNLFVATNHGLCELSPKNGSWNRIRTFFKDKQITSLTRNSKGVFALTFEGKIFQLDKNGSVKLIHQLDENYRAVQLQYHNNTLYIATNLGMVIYGLESHTTKIINRYNGLNSNNISRCFIDKNWCWVSTGNGIHRLLLSKNNNPQPSGKLIIRGVFVNNKKVNPSSVLHLRYSDDFKVQLDGLCYRSNGNFDFAYRFIGDKTGWITVPASQKEFAIPRLPMGSVNIELKLIDHENQSSVNRIQLHLDVHPPFWQRWWFYLLSVGFIIGISYLIFKSRLKQLRLKQEVKLKQLQLENELRLTQQSALKAQMNPHFLFNVLNSIKGYIYENDKKNAARYLGDFSSLVRKILEMSAVPSVSLSDEIETLTLYINLESILLEDDFSFQLEIDPTVDCGAIEIPSLLLQPYVENAFKHGLRHKKGAKSLKIQVSQDRNASLLVIRINDNGIGRKAAEVINRNQQIKHQSFATNANAKRIELLNFERSGVIGIQIEDIYSKIGEAAGTEVTIQIHL